MDVSTVFLIDLVIIGVILYWRYKSNQNKKWGNKYKKNIEESSTQIAFRRNQQELTEKRILDPESGMRLRSLYLKTASQWTWNDCVFMLLHSEHHKELCSNDECKPIKLHARIYVAVMALYLYYGKYSCFRCGSKHCKPIYRSEILPKRYDLNDIGTNPSNWLFLCNDCYYRNIKNEYLYNGFSDPVKPRLPGEKIKYKPFHTMTPKEFEKFVASVFMKKGYSVSIVGGSGDDGVDILLKRGSVKGIVQVKRYKNKITPKMIREFAGALTGTDASEAYFVTSSDFSDNAKKWAKKTHITLVSGEMLNQWWSNL